MDFLCIAHQVLVMNTLGTLAGPDVGQHLGQAPVDANINKGGAGGMVLRTAHSDGCGVAFGMVVEGTIGYAAVGYVRGHLDILRGSAAPAGQLFVSTVGLSGQIKKTQSCDLIPAAG